MVKLRARCLLLGDAAVGKTALSHVFHSDGTLFQKNYSMTSGVELLLKCVNLPDSDSSSDSSSSCSSSDSVELYILDSAGKEALVETSSNMWGQPSVLCLVFDLTSDQSFGSCGRWLQRVSARWPGLSLPGVLVGNKSDLSSRREVQTSRAQDWARSRGLDYHETSAKEMENCEAPLLSLARAFRALYQDRRQAAHHLGPS